MPLGDLIRKESATESPVRLGTVGRGTLLAHRA